MKRPLTEFGTPWSMHYDRNGTEDIAVIRDAEGYDLAYSAEFWFPERRDPIPVSLAATKLMFAAPDLREALHFLLEQTVDMDLKHGITLTKGEKLARAKALKAIKKASFV